MPTTTLQHTHATTSLSETVGGTLRDAKAAITEIGQAVLQQFASPAPQRVVIEVPVTDPGIFGDLPELPHGIAGKRRHGFSHTDTPRDGLDTSELHFAG